MFKRFQNNNQGMNNGYMRDNQQYQDQYNPPYPSPMQIQMNQGMQDYQVEGGNTDYTLQFLQDQINELKREKSFLSSRITKLENYLGINASTQASNYQ